MKKFGIYKLDADEYRAVKYGFSFAGCLFQPIWLAYKGMFVRGVFFGLAYALLGNLIYGMEKDASSLQYGLFAFVSVLQHPPLIENETLRMGVSLFRTMAFGLIIGAFGNEWHRKSLLKRGFSHVTDTEAPNEKIALEHARNVQAT